MKEAAHQMLVGDSRLSLAIWGWKHWTERDYPKLNHEAAFPTCVIGALVEIRNLVMRGSPRPGILLPVSAPQLQLFGSQDSFN